MRLHRSTSLLTVTVALLLIAGPSLGEETDASGPVAVFPEFSHDYGDVIKGEKLVYSFVVKNEGQELLLIKSVQPT